MKKIIVVDDEPIIANGISSLVKQIDLPLSLEATLYGGEEAISFCREQPIDIVITDINMPEINGIELIQALKAINPNIQIIILTGFGTISYAKETMALGCRFFLEKPIEIPLLTDALEKSIVYSQENARLQKLSWRKEIEKFMIEKGTGPLTIPFPLQFFFYDSKYYPNLSQRLSQTSFKDQLISATLKKTGFHLYLSDDDQLLTTFQQFVADKVLNQGIIFHATIDNKEELYHTFSQGIHYLDRDFYFTSMTLLPVAQGFNHASNQNDYLVFRQKFVTCVLNGELSEANEMILAYFQDCRHHLYPIRLLQFQINDLLEWLIERYHLRENILFENFSLKIAHLTNWEALQFLITEALRLLKEQLILTEDGDIAKNINLIIEQYYAEEDLSLKWIAQNLLFLNPDYIGKMYLKKTGTRFTTKLLTFRIEKAKQLLLQDYKIYEVANKVGFGNTPEYFTQVFKKFTGLTPKQYKTKMTI